MSTFKKRVSYIPIVLLLLMQIAWAQEKNQNNSSQPQVTDVNEKGKESVNGGGYSDSSTNRKELENVVVIGYGRIKKEDATGSVSAITVDEKSKLNAASPQELLMGKVAGVQINTSGGRPGDGATIRIRGGSSLNASNDPLIVIDGVPVDNGVINGMTNPLTAINPNDIESFTVLKDASATAIYGSRASNGVILITTKKGSTGKLNISYNGNVSVGTYTRLLPVMSANQFTNEVQQYAPKGYSILGMTDAQGNQQLYNTNWQKQIYQPAVGTDHNVSAMGTYKTEKAGKITLPYRVSLGYTYQNGILKTSNMQRGTIDISLAPTFLNNHLTVNINAKGMVIDNRFADPGAVANAVSMDPTKLTYSNLSGQSYNGYTAWLLGGVPNNNSTLNPLSLLYEKNDKATAYRSIGNAQIEYKVHHFEELKAVLNLGYDVSSSKGYTQYPIGSNLAWYQQATGGIRGDGSINDYNQFKKNNLLDFYLNYNKEVKSIFSTIDATLGYSWQHFYSSANSTSKGLAKDTIYTQIPTATENYLVSFFGRLNWNLMDRYLFTFTMRSDGSSRFAKGNQFGYFPAGAFAWRIINEKFMANTKNVLSDLKLRVGVGSTGQQDVGNDYPAMAIYNTSLYNSGALYQMYTDANGKPVYVQITKPLAYDPKLKWETTTTYNVGIDYGFLQNRITGSVEYYYRNTTNLLNTVPVPTGSNLAAQVLTNVGSLWNQGVEFSINATAINTPKVRWDLGFNITYNKTQITKLYLQSNTTSPGVQVGGIAGGTGNTIQILSVGYSPYAFYVYQQVYDKAGKPIEGLYVDQNKDGKIDTKDLIQYKKPNPDVYLGFTSRLSFYNFDFSFSLRAQLGNWVYNNIAAQGSTALIYNSGQSFLSNKLQDLAYTQFANQQLMSSYYIQNASFLRMDNINLGYTFNNVGKTKIGIRVYAMIQNVFVITKYTGIDPEIYGGIDNNFYPRPRTYTVGVNFNF